MQNEVWKSIAATIARAALLWLLGVIAAKAPGLAKTVNDIVGQLGGVQALSVSIGGALVVLALALWARIKSRAKLAVALDSAPGTTEAQVKKVVAQMNTSTVISAAASGGK